MRKISALPNSEPDSTNYPFGRIKDKTDEEAGTPVIEATYSDHIQSLFQFLRVTGKIPNGLPESTANGFQLFQAMEEFLCPVGTIRLWPSTVVPAGWLRCDGMTYGISSYQELYAVIGTTFGTPTAGAFNVPNFLGRVPVGNYSSLSIGEQIGEAYHTLSFEEMPKHAHYNGIADDQTTHFVYNAVASEMPGNATKTLTNESGSCTYQGRTGYSGDSQPHINMQPSLGMNFIIKAKYGKDI